LYYSTSSNCCLLAILTLMITAKIVIQIHREKILAKMIVMVATLIPPIEDPEISVSTIIKVGVFVS
jgi:hypothetical protein